MNSTEPAKLEGQIVGRRGALRAVYRAHCREIQSNELGNTKFYRE